MAQLKPKRDQVIDQQTIKKCAQFLVNKNSIRTIHGYFFRSIGPVKMLLKDIFSHCSFRKNQLVALKDFTKELEAIVESSIPLLTQMMFLLASHPQVEHLIKTIGLDQGSIGNYGWDEINEARLFINERDPVLWAMLSKQQHTWEGFIVKWEETIASLIDYMSVRLKIRQPMIEKNIQTFNKYMIWKHIGPTISLAMRTSWNARKLLTHNDDGQMMFALLQEIYTQIMAKKNVLERNIIYYAKKSTNNYSLIIQQVINENLSRTV